MEIVRYWKAIKRRLWIIIFLCAIAVGSAVWQDSVQPPRYSATALLVINPNVPAAQLPFYDPETTAKYLSETYGYWIHTRAFGNLVSKAMGGDASADEVTGSINSRQAGNTRFFELSAQSGTPERAQLLANTAAAVFVAENPQQKEKPSDDTVKLLQSELAYFRDREQSQQKVLEELLARRPTTDEIDKQITKTQTQLDSARDYVIKILTALNQAGITDVTGGSKAADTAFIVDAASMPTRPIGARSSQNIMFALAAALALGIGVVLLLEYLDLAVTIRTPEELEAALGLPTLGVVGVITGADRHEKALITVDHPKSPNAEAFRSVDTNIKLSRAGSAIRSILVTSAGPSEGKTITACNLAVAISETGDSVVLIDGDLRRPTVHKYFGVSNSSGLTNLLVDETSDVTQHMTPSFVENLWLIPSGPVPPRPSVLLSTPRMNEVLQRLLDSYQVVIMDSPPVMAVTDAVVLSSQMDGVLLVVMAGRTSRDLLNRSKETLTNVGATLIGAVLNRVRAADLGAYYLYHYYRYARHKSGRTGAVSKQEKEALRGAFQQ